MKETIKYGHYTTTKIINGKLFNCNDDHHKQVHAFNQRTAYCLLYVKKTPQQPSSTPTAVKNSSPEKRKYCWSDPLQQQSSAVKKLKVTFVASKSFCGEILLPSNKNRTMQRRPLERKYGL